MLYHKVKLAYHLHEANGRVIFEERIYPGIE
jgi:hypothetical protein